jgi:hypothetical protein
MRCACARSIARVPVEGSLLDGGQLPVEVVVFHIDRRGSPLTSLICLVQCRSAYFGSSSLESEILEIGSR